VQSPCRRCGEPALHTKEESYPLCAACTERRVWLGIIRDIQDGRLEIPDELIEELGGSHPA
jgi:hypothetical protein